MTTHKYKVDDFVVWEDMHWKHGLISYKGRVLKLLPNGRYSIQFEKKFNDTYHLGHIYNSFSDVEIKYAGPPLTKEERLFKKCKHLWNESNWVKNNPTQAY